MRKHGCKRRLDADSRQAILGHSAGVMQALLSAKVWMIGAFFFFALTCTYAYNFSAPAILQIVTGWSVSPGRVLGGCFWFGGRQSRCLPMARTPIAPGERAMHCIVPCLRDGSSFSGRGLRTATLAGGCLAGRQLRRIHFNAGPRPRRAYAVSGWARLRSGYRCDEHHHHVQRIPRPLLDGA